MLSFSAYIRIADVALRHFRSVKKEQAMRNAPTDVRESLAILWSHAKGHSSGQRVILRFLLALHDGKHYPIDLTELQRIGATNYARCITVLNHITSTTQPVTELIEQIAITRYSKGEIEELAYVRNIHPIERT
jgi:hypothetical protein